MSRVAKPSLLVLVGVGLVLGCHPHGDANPARDPEPVSGAEAEPIAHAPVVIVEAQTIENPDARAESGPVESAIELDWQRVDASLSPMIAAVGEARVRTPYGPEQAWFGATVPSVTVVVYVDYECPFCEVEDNRLRALVAQYPQDLRVVLRMYPLGSHARAEAAARAMLAAQVQGPFLAMHEALFANRGALEDRDLRNYAQGLHLDLARFERDLHSEAVSNKLSQDRLSGDALGLVGVPTVYLNGREVQNSAGLEAMIEEELALVAVLLDNGVPRPELWARMLAAGQEP